MCFNARKSKHVYKQMDCVNWVRLFFFRWKINIFIWCVCACGVSLIHAMGSHSFFFLWFTAFNYQIWMRKKTAQMKENEVKWEILSEKRKCEKRWRKTVKRCLKWSNRIRCPFIWYWSNTYRFYWIFSLSRTHCRKVLLILIEAILLS